MAIVSGNPMDAGPPAPRNPIPRIQPMDRWNPSGFWERRSLVPLTIPRWSESRRSLANRGPQRSAPPTPTSLAKPGTTPNSPGSWPGSTWCCRTGCRSFGRSTFVEPVSRTGYTVPISCDTRCGTHRGPGAISFSAIPRNASSSCDACWSNCNRISKLSACLARRFGPSRRLTRRCSPIPSIAPIRISCGWRCPACGWNSGSSTIRRGTGGVCSLRWAMHLRCSAAAGRSLRAWMQRMGLTWAYRLSKEPLRLGPRYLRYNSMFVSYWLWDALRGQSPERNFAIRKFKLPADFRTSCDERAGDQWHFTGRGCAPISCRPARGGNDADRTAIGFRNAATTADVSHRIFFHGVMAQVYRRSRPSRP